MKKTAARSYYTPDLFTFLKQLKQNNDRDWFQANKHRYDEIKGRSLKLIEDFKVRLHTISPHFLADARPVGGSLFRIYRDIRFSGDKSPYKTHIGIHFRHRRGAKDVHAPGFYLHLEPGQSFAAAGIWHPDAMTTRRIRSAILDGPKDWSQACRKLNLEGDSLKRPPTGYDPKHPLIEDLKRKDFISSVDLTSKQILDPKFPEILQAHFEKLSPLVFFLSDALKLPH